MNDLIYKFLGSDIPYSIVVFSVVIGLGIYLARFKVKGISLGITWVLFVGIFIGHLGFVLNPALVSFMRDFGLALFVFAVGLQVGPGFFQAFKKGGVLMNVLALCLVLLGVGTVVLLSFITKVDLQTLTGVMSGAVTNIPGLGAAQTTLVDGLTSMGKTPEVANAAASDLAAACAVAYPMGVLGVILVLILFKIIFKIDINKELEELDNASKNTNQARRMHCLVTNPHIFGKTIKEVKNDSNISFVVSRIMRNDQIRSVSSGTQLEEGDKVLIVTTDSCVDSLRTLFGTEIPIHLQDWEEQDFNNITKNIVITKSKLTGYSLRTLNIRALYGVTVTRVIRAGVELVADPNLILKMGDTLKVVGSKSNIDKVADLLGNKLANLNAPNLIPIFLGIVLGVIVGSIPIIIPGIPLPVKLGVAGGPLIISIFIGYFAPKMKVTTYTTISANMMIREIGIAFFMAAVGLTGGQSFISSILGGGYWWILYGTIITVLPVLTIVLVARFVFKLNYFQICGLIAGGCTNPPVLAFETAGANYTAINYATVFPFAMFLRVMVAQLLILFAIM